MKRVVVINWKEAREEPIEVFSNLKILCEAYPVYNYNTLNNYLSKGKIPFENAKVRIERKIVRTSYVQKRKIKLVSKKVSMRNNDEERQNLDYWMSRPEKERLIAVTRLSAQLKKSPDQRMNKTVYRKRKA